MASSLPLFEAIARRANQFTQSRSQRDRDEHPFDERNIDAAVQEQVKGLFDDGHYMEASRKALVFLDNEVKRRAKAAGYKTSKSGFDLMMHVFKEDGPPVLALTALGTTSEIDEQEGYKHIFGGAMKGLRNPRSHEHALKDSPDLCLDILTLVSLLLRRVAEAGFK